MVTLRRDSGDQCGALLSIRPKGPAVPFGSKVVQGPRDLLEDAFSVASVAQPGPSPSSPGPSAQYQNDSELSFFGVYDGHGGAEAAQHAASRLHLHFSDALVQEACSATVSTESVCSQTSAAACADALLAQEWSGSSTGQPDSDILDMLPEAPAPGWAGAVKAMAPLNDRYSHTLRRALQSAFIRTDADLAGTEVGEVVGTTAVVAVVGRSEVYVAHCGDSRAVLCRKGIAIPLTNDHKPDRPDERERVSALGGKIVFKGGSHRVMGLLAMTRAIGDHLMRPYVVPDPEVMSMQRTYDDELLVLASDGLWDVFTCQEATTLALRSTMRARERGASASAACRIGASVLARGAVERGSKDNITVLVIDLRLRQDSPAGSVAAVLASQCSDAPFSGLPYARRKRSSSGAGDDALQGQTAAPVVTTPVTTGAPGWCSSNGGLVRQQQQQRSQQPQRQSHMEAVVSTWAAAAAAFSPNGNGSTSGYGGRSGSRTDGGGWPRSLAGPSTAAGPSSSGSTTQQQPPQQQPLSFMQSLPTHPGVAPAAAAFTAAAGSPRSLPAATSATPLCSGSHRSQSFTTSTLHGWRPSVEDMQQANDQGIDSSSSGVGGTDSVMAEGSDQPAAASGGGGNSSNGTVFRMGCVRPGLPASAMLESFSGAGGGCCADKPPVPPAPAQR